MLRQVLNINQPLFPLLFREWLNLIFAYRLPVILDHYCPLLGVSTAGLIFSKVISKTNTA
jgi:hypothetical protein